MVLYSRALRRKIWDLTKSKNILNFDVKTLQQFQTDGC